jgi:hypothetical protein
MCTIAINPSFHLASGVISDVTISGNVSGPGSVDCRHVTITLSDSLGVFAQAINVPLSVVGKNYSQMLFPTRNVMCGTSITIDVKCVEIPNCQGQTVVVFPCEDCPAITFGPIVTGPCLPDGSRVYSVTLNFSQPCQYQVTHPTTTAVIATGTVLAPGTDTFSVGLSGSGSLNLVLTVTSPAGCQGLIIPLSLVECTPPCPQISISNLAFGPCNADGYRTVSATVTASGTGPFSANVLLDGTPIPGGNITGSAAFQFSHGLAGGSTHTISVDVKPDSCPDSSLTFTVTECEEPCPDVVFTSKIGNCRPDGTRIVTVDVTASGSSNYAGEVLLNGSLIGTLTPASSSFQFQQALTAGTSHVFAVDFPSEPHCGSASLHLDLATCDEVTEEPGEPRIPCVMCKKCQDYLTKIGLGIWSIIGCKLLMLLLVAAFGAGFSGFAGGAAVYNLSSFSFGNAILVLFGLTGFIWWYLLDKNCGNCCVYCAILWGVIFGIIVAIVIWIYTQQVNWLGVAAVVTVAVFLLAYNETTVKKACKASL